MGIKSRIKEGLFELGSRLLSESMLERLLRRAAAGMKVAVCCHRVAPTHRETDPYPDITGTPEALDGFLRSARRALGPNAVTMTFDDGYVDAYEYVKSRAPQYPEVEWLFFVCPDKLQRRAGFRWDEYEELVKSGAPAPSLKDHVLGGQVAAEESARPGLQGLADKPDYTMVTLEQCRELEALPNVSLGNHTNAHLVLTMIPDGDAKADLKRSTRDYESMFGPCRQFAFAFGTPRAHFNDTHVEYLRGLRPGLVLWSIEERFFGRQERREGAVLPRLVFNGKMSAKRMLLWAIWKARKAPPRLSAAPTTQPAGAA